MAYKLIIVRASGDIESTDFAYREDAVATAESMSKDARDRNKAGEPLDPIGVQVDNEDGNQIFIWNKAPCMTDMEGHPIADNWEAVMDALGLNRAVISMERVQTVEDTEALMSPGKATIRSHYFNDVQAGTDEGTTVADVLRAVEGWLAETPDDHQFVEDMRSEYTPQGGHVIHVTLGS